MISKKEFGRTGHQSTRALFGGAALWDVTQEEANKVLDLLLNYGVNHIDTAASYGDSELRIGPWMKNHRKDFFLATKTGMRTYQEAKEELHKSMERLQTDYVDLWQMHVLVNQQEWERAMGPGGALEAFVEAKEQGLVRYLGVTGHGLAAAKMHLESLEVYDFDAVLLPFNFILMQNGNYAEDFCRLQEKCLEKNVAIQTIKSVARGPKPDDMGGYTTWYEPLADQKAINSAIAWVLGNPDVFVNTVGDIKILEKVLKAAEKFSFPPDDDTMIAEIEKYGIKPLFITDEI
ncbi:MAG: aldo/keto reductase [Candidatus Marinimicrobia bacterium]|nr:aldo/keto reductase [Candidatus Neomarinimicrobiota bacterium]